MEHIYEETAPWVNSFEDMLAEGVYYGRIRLNSFGFKWKGELFDETGNATRKNHAIVGLGGSLIYHSAVWNGFSFAGSLYTTQARGTLEKNEAYLNKSGKDTFSRYDFLRTGKKGITTPAEGYLAYSYDNHMLKVGRQIFESFLTKSNDTKMIPNTFEGISLYSNFFDTAWKAAFFTKQKLRDHANFHHLFAYGEEEGKPYSAYSQNDDSAMHRGITLSKLKDRGIEDRLFVIEGMNRSIENLNILANYTTVPELLSYAMIQLGYEVDLGEWFVIPAVRYMYQFDEGAGHIAGANYLNLTEGYSNPQSLESNLLAARIDVVHDTFKLRFGYSDVADKGDIIAPWRGFPTGGFTRAMGQYNWYANTKSYMFQLDYVFDAFDELKLISRYVIQDFDDNKIGVQSDSNVFTLDLAKKLLDNRLYLKTRYAYVSGDDDTVTTNGFAKVDSSYNEIRFEINYLF